MKNLAPHIKGQKLPPPQKIHCLILIEVLRLTTQSTQTLENYPHKVHTGGQLFEQSHHIKTLTKIDLSKNKHHPNGSPQTKPLQGQQSTTFHTQPLCCL